MTRHAPLLVPVFLVASLCGCSDSDEWTPDGSITDGDLVGHWVWAQHVDGTDTVLTITDDGRGFDPERATPGRLGLGIMRERIQSVGASLSLETQKDKGTTIQVVWKERLHGDFDG